MLYQPPKSTLFPYTTLFRSQIDLGPRDVQKAQRIGRSQLPRLFSADDVVGNRRDGRGSVPRRSQGAERMDDGQIGRATSELQSQSNLVCRLLLEKKKNK